MSFSSFSNQVRFVGSRILTWLERIFNQKYKLFALSAMLLLGTLIYSNTFHSSFHLDDSTSIVDNPAIRNILDPQAIWNFWPTRFITYLSAALNYHFSQLNVFSYHIFNLIVHLGSGILVWWFMLLTFSTPVMKAQKITMYARLIALFTGLVFIAHPIQTQGVTYIIQRAASLTTLFYLLSLNLYVKFRLLQKQGESSISPGFFYWSALMAAAMAIFTKEMAITLPLMALLYELCFLKTKERLNWKYLIPFFGIALVIPLTMFLTKYVDFIGMRRALEEPFNISSRQYLFTQFRVIVTYLRLLFIPVNQNIDYYYPVAKNLLELPILASLILLISILTVAIRIFSKYRLISFGIFWLFLTLLPESSVIPIKDVIFEHRLYLPMVGFSFFLTSLIYYFFENKALKSMVIVLLIITSSYAVLAYRRNFIWKDEFTLWNDAVHKSPKKERPYNNRGSTYYEQDNFTQAILDFNRAIEINPNYADAHYGRGTAYCQQGNFTQAILDFNRAIEITPNDADIYNNRGFAYKNQGNIKQAISDFNKAIEINPDFEAAYNNLENAYIEQGTFTQAILDLSRAIEINPKDSAAYNNRGNVYMEQGSIKQAISDYTRAIEINPNFEKAYNNRGTAYYRKIKFTQAISDYSRAIEINPNFAEAYNNRGVVYYLSKEYDKAWKDVHKAEGLGYAVNPEFLTELKKASRRNKNEIASLRSQ